MKIGGSDLFMMRLIRENGTYLVGFVILVVALIFSIGFFSVQYRQSQDKISQSKQELNTLKDKVNYIRYRNEIVTAGVDIDSMNQLFNSLVPESEDFFSIALALEKLSSQTNFIITSYTINIKDSTQGKLSLTIRGQGDADSFLEFLKDYNFAGARLITIDKISFNQQLLTGTELLANFYSKKTNLDQSIQSKPLTPADKQLIDSIRNKVVVDFTQSTAVGTDYPTKSNPF